MADGRPGQGGDEEETDNMAAGVTRARTRDVSSQVVLKQSQEDSEATALTSAFVI